MLQRMLKPVVAATLFALICSIPAAGRMALEAGGTKSQINSRAAQAPVHCLVGHRVGKIELGLANNGTLGTNNAGGPTSDWFTGEEVPDCQYPKNSQVEYLFSGAFWIGAIVGRDTLVSVGADGWQRTQEMFPDARPFGEIVRRSITDPTKPEYEYAVSEEDYVAVYMDTLTEGVDADVISGRPHTPLNIEVTQSSFAWSYSYAEDFVLFDYQIRNIGTQTLEEVYMGIYVDADVGFDLENTQGFADDICGFLPTYPASYGSIDTVETVSIAWIADNDGDLGVFFTDGQEHPCPHVTATRIVRTPSDSLDISFNWWIGNGNPDRDFGPRERPFVGRLKEAMRDFGTGGLGTPEGDGNKYYSLRNQEFDYDQIYTGIKQPNDTLWLYPNQSLAANFADGYDTRYLLSFGPFDIRPDQTLPISFAYVGGENLHSDENNVANLPGDPDAYYRNLDFSDLALNARWASWVYDNPGVDTDGDGYSGEFLIEWLDSAIDSIYPTVDPLTGDPETDTAWSFLLPDTHWTRGDNVPDFKGASPPPAPVFWIDQSIGQLRIRFNGLLSETTRDVFSGDHDFEGYRVYMARDIRASSYTLIASYDREDYNRHVLNERLGTFELLETPFTLDQIRGLFGEGDPTYDPLAYSRTNPDTLLRPGDTIPQIFFFEPQDFNASIPGVSTPIRKIYPNQPYPTTLNPLEALPEELTEDSYLKYFEYEYTIDSLLPTVPYWVTVTAFDYGSPESGLASLETAVTLGARMAYALPDWEQVQTNNLDAYIYPNPYRFDANYRENGFEGRVETLDPEDRIRVLHFANLPPLCWIRIYSIDGDLVREIEHTDRTTHDEWNLITRNTQVVVSGLYYWTVENTETGDVQIGKLVVIM